MATHIIKMFLKFGEEEHVKDLYYKGTIYMNSIQYFRTIEEDELRGDKYEGITQIKNYPLGEIEISALNFKGNYLALQLRESYEIVLGNIFSLYCISSQGWENPHTFKIDERIKRFGSYCLMIKDNKKFLSLVEEKLNELRIKFSHSFVTYYDKNNVDRKITLFEKPLEFQYQKEFRFYVERDSHESFSFSVGSLTDIAEVHRSIDVVDTLKLI